MEFDSLPDALSCGRKQDDRVDIPWKPRAEFSEIQVSFVTSEDERLNLTAERFQRP